MKRRVECIKIIGRMAGMACLLLLSFPIPAYAQQDVQARLNRLENEIQTLSRALFKGEMPPPGAVPGESVSAEVQASLEVRLSQLEMEVRTLTGQLEQQQYEMRQFQDKLEKALTDMEMRLMDMEARLVGRKTSGDAAAGYNPVPGSAVQGAPVTAEPTYRPSERGISDMASSPDADIGEAGQPLTGGNLGTLVQTEFGDYRTIDDPTEAYEIAFSLLKEKNYAEAEKAFEIFLERFPGHSLAPNALYWLGETHYVRNNFEGAARVFAEAYQKYPQGPKGPDNLLKLALSLAGMGKTKDACIALGQLKREYPAGANPVLVRADHEMQRLGCS